MIENKQSQSLANYTLTCPRLPVSIAVLTPGGNQVMKLAIHASIFSIVFAGFVAGAVTTKHTASTPASHSLVLSHFMPVPNCPPHKGCIVKAQNEY
jgi:hypothetical protein